jgi:hypothetical protein
MYFFMLRLYQALLQQFTLRNRDARPNQPSTTHQLKLSDVAEVVTRTEAQLLFASDRQSRAEIRELKSAIDNMRLTLWAMMPETFLSSEQTQMLQRHCALRKLVLSDDLEEMPALDERAHQNAPACAQTSDFVALTYRSSPDSGYVMGVDA